MLIGKNFSIDIGSKTLTATFSDLARKAHGSVTLTYGDTVLVATAVMKKAAPNAPYFNFVVDYEERNYARGAILGGSYAKREGKPSDEAVLTSRMIDRALRPYFTASFRDEVQVIITVLAAEKDQDPGPIALLGASLALAVSHIPWNGPVSGIRIAQVGSDFVINPSISAALDATIDLIVAGKDGKIMMLDGEASQADESVAIAAIGQAMIEIANIQAFQEDIMAKIGTPKTPATPYEMSVELHARFANEIAPAINTLFSPNEAVSSSKINDLLTIWLGIAAAVDKNAPKGDLEAHFTDAVRIEIEKNLFDQGKRLDGRKYDEIRPLFAQVGGISRVLHGSGLFYRGETHVATFATLGSENDALTLEGMEVSGKKYFIHHYNFPPFSAGETGRIGSPNRRAIGHGALAEKALRKILPPRSEFPHTIRLVSEVFSSNGSTSMASVCAGSLALANADIKITGLAAGISIGLISTKTSDYKLLTDIAGLEDHFGDMDFKVAGTAKGVVAVQLDVKNSGISLEIAAAAFSAAKQARNQILPVLEAAVAALDNVSHENLPKNHTISIPQGKIGGVIGPRGATIQAISQATGTRIDIKPDGTVTIFGTGEAAAKATELISKNV